MKMYFRVSFLFWCAGPEFREGWPLGRGDFSARFDCSFRILTKVLTGVVLHTVLGSRTLVPVRLNLSLHECVCASLQARHLGSCALY